MTRTTSCTKARPRGGWQVAIALTILFAMPATLWAHGGLHDAIDALGVDTVCAGGAWSDAAAPNRVE